MILRFLKDDENGSISIELALISSVVFLSIIPLTDIMTRIYNGQQLASATRAAMQYAINNPNDEAGTQKAAQNNAGSLDQEQMEISTSEFCECNNTVQTCGDVCAYSEEKFLTVSATYNQSLMMDYPVYGNEVPITRELTVRK